MGMYTRLVLNVAIKEKTPSVALVQAMLATDDAEQGPVPDDRRRWMLRCCSHYHDNIQAAQFEHDEIAHTWKLSVTCDLKNYEQEIQWFLATIAPDVETNDLAGYVRYEEAVQPELVWFVDGKPVYFTPDHRGAPPEIARLGA